MIITRNLINKKILYTDCSTYKDTKYYDYNQLDMLINSYKNLLIKKGAQKGNSIVLGDQASLSQIAMVFACAELGLTITIISEPLQPNNSKSYNRKFLSNKTKLLMPIDFFLVSDKNQTDKFDIFYDICTTTIITADEELDFTTNVDIWADENTVFLKCTSSGTTNTPKIISHSHNFLGNLLLRNKIQFYGKMGMFSNLAHGSSPAVYFLPGLMSENVIEYVNFCDITDWTKVMTTIVDLLSTKNISLDHLLVPYTMFIDKLFSNGKSLSTCVIYTLSIIKESWIDKCKQGFVKDVISIFGTNETSGPIFYNKASSYNFHPNKYTIFDNFYEIRLLENNSLEVGIPIYNKFVNTEDLFVKENDRYLHQGRNNLYRINDLELDLEFYNRIISELMTGQLIIDVLKESIYLVVWDDYLDTSKINQINALMKMNSKGLHYISKFDKLGYGNFLSGIKLDMEMLREYFRTM